MMSDRQQVVKYEAEISLLVADVFECAGLLRRSGELIASVEGQSQARWQLLSVLSDRRLTVPQAARRLGVSRQAVQRVANDLVDAGLVGLASNPEHRGSPLLSPTDSGRDTLAAISEAGTAFNHQLATTVSAEDLQIARRVLQALVKEMSNHPKTSRPPHAENRPEHRSPKPQL